MGQAPQGAQEYYGPQAAQPPQSPPCQTGPQGGPQCPPQYGPQEYAQGPAASGYGYQPPCAPQQGPANGGRLEMGQPGPAYGYQAEPGGSAQAYGYAHGCHGHYHHDHHGPAFAAFPGQGHGGYSGPQSGFPGGFDPMSLIGQLGAQYGQFGQGFCRPGGQTPGAGYVNPGPQPGFGDPNCLENHYGKMVELYSDFVQGKTDPAKIMSFLTSTGAHFWKGAAVGALLTFILTNGSVKSAVAEAFTGVFGGKESADN